MQSVVFDRGGRIFTAFVVKVLCGSNLSNCYHFAYQSGFYFLFFRYSYYNKGVIVQFTVRDYLVVML